MRALSEITKKRYKVKNVMDIIDDEIKKKYFAEH